MIVTDNPTSAGAERPGRVAERSGCVAGRRPAPGEPDAGAHPAAGQASTDRCAWCGASIAEGEAFVLRVGATLCPDCAEQAGRIAAEQKRTET